MLAPQTTLKSVSERLTRLVNTRWRDRSSSTSDNLKTTHLLLPPTVPASNKEQTRLFWSSHPDVIAPPKAFRTFSGGFFLFLFLGSSARTGLATPALSGSQPRGSVRDVGFFPSSGALRTAAQDTASSSSTTTAVAVRTIHVGYRSGSRPRSTPKRVRM